MSPVAAGFDDDEFVSASGVAEFGGVGAGRDADGFFVDERAALRLGGGEAGEDEQEREDSDGERDAFPNAEGAFSGGICPFVAVYWNE